jgi:hypothetical protein
MVNTAMRTHLSASTRLILAVLRLSADIAEGFGRAVIDILSKQYPEMKKEMAEDPQFAENPAASIGHKLVAIARKQLQYNDQDAYDAIQDLLVYIVTSKFDFKAETKKGNPGASTWKKALSNIYANLHAKAMSHSFKKFKSGKHTDEEIYADLIWRRTQALGENSRYTWTDKDDEELMNVGNRLVKNGVDIKSIAPTKLRRKNVRDKSLDEAFGKRGEGGEGPEGGVGRMPQDADTIEGMPLDEKAAKKSFLDALDQLIPDLKQSFPLTNDKLPAQRMLFDFIFDEDGSGTFLPDVKANMGQATDFRNYLEEISTRAGPNAKEAQAILKRYGKRWSGFVGDTRTRLMKSIQNFVEEYLPENEYEQLWNAFYSDITPQSAEKIQTRKNLEQLSYLRNVDLRKLLRMEERQKLGLLSDKETKERSSLRQRLLKDIAEENAEFQSELERYKKRMLTYLEKQSRYSDLPPEKQPKLPIKRPVKPKKPLSLDEQLKTVMAEDGEKIRREVEEEFKIKLDQDEQKKKEKEVAESLAEDANAEVDARYDAKHGVAAFFKRFLPEFP